MNATSAAERWAKRAAVALSTLFVVDLFLDWHKTAIYIGRAVNVESTASGWQGFGIAAGVFGVLVIVFATNEMPLGAFASAVGAFAAATVALFTGSATVPAPAGIAVVDSTLWSAWLGVALAAGMTAATATPVLKAYANTPSAASHVG